ncbi:MAG: sulfurase [bacterium]
MADGGRKGRATLRAIYVKRFHRGPMDRVEEGELVPGQGLAGSADQGGRRQITLLEEEVWDEMMRRLHVQADPSVRRANLLVRGIPLKKSRGRVLQVGGCRIRINGELKPCERMDEAVPGLQKLLFPAWHGGAYGEIVEGGVIHVGAPVHFVETATDGDDGTG